MNILKNMSFEQPSFQEKKEKIKAELEVTTFDFEKNLEKLLGKKVEEVEVIMPDDFKVRFSEKEVESKGSYLHPTAREKYLTYKDSQGRQERDEDEYDDEGDDKYGEGLEKILNIVEDQEITNYYRGYGVPLALKIEGVNGIILGVIDKEDGYRSHFNKWAQITGLDEYKILDKLGKIKDMKEVNKDKLNETIIETEDALIKFGGDGTWDEWYPRGFCEVEKQK